MFVTTSKTMSTVFNFNCDITFFDMLKNIMEKYEFLKRT